MDARAWMVRLAVGVGPAATFTSSARAQTPTPTATPSGAPKIVLAFDASGLPGEAVAPRALVGGLGLGALGSRRLARP